MKVSKINVAFLIDTMSCDTAGTQKQLIGIVERLDKNRFSPLIICLYSSLWLEENELPCPVTVLGYRGLLKRNILSVIMKLRSIVKQVPVHILQTFFEDSIFVAFFAGLAGGDHRCILLSSRRDMGLGVARPWYHQVFSMILPLVSQYFDGIVCNGQEIKTWVSRREKVPSGKIRVIPNGTLLPPPVNGTPELFTRYHSSLWIGLVASLTPIKRIDVFLRALRRVVVKRPDIEFRAVVLGEGPLNDALHEIAREEQIYDRVHFVGAVQDVSSFLHRIDIGVLCSDREGFSNSVLEYMAHSLPVVVTRVGGNIELVTPATGLGVPAGDAEALSDALIQLADDPTLRKQLGEAGRQMIESQFSWQTSMAVLEGYYLQMLGQAFPRE
jgi:L-malate glycosyltransferase